MATQEPFTASGALLYSPDDGKPQVQHDASHVGQFTQKAEEKLDLTGSGTHAVGFGSIATPGVKAVQIEVDVGLPGQQPILVRVNGGTDDIELSPGGFITYCNPNPVAGITSLDIVHTTDVCVQVRLLG